MTDRILLEAEGYCMLGMHEDALQVLEELSPSEARLEAVYSMRLTIYSSMKDHASGASVAREAVLRFPDNLEFYINGAWCVRRSENLENAWELLSSAAQRCDRLSALWYYNMACYECQRGNLEEVEDYFGRAVSLDKSFETLAASDEDLRDWLQSR